MKLELKPENHYERVHAWLNKKYGKASKCLSKTCNGKSKRFHYAIIHSKDHEYNRDNYITLCQSCHKKYDMTDETRSKMSKSKRGDCHPRKKLNEEQVLIIRNEYKFRKVTCKMLAKKYNVCEHTILYIIQRRTWKHI